MTRSSKTAPLTLEQRIDDLIHMSQGTCPYAIIVWTEAEAAEARRLLAKKRNAKLIEVKLEDRK